MTLRLPPGTQARLRAAAQKREDALRRAAQAQRARQRRRIAAGCWDRGGKAERKRRE